jgi:hypothetical protein
MQQNFIFIETACDDFIEVWCTMTYHSYDKNVVDFTKAVDDFQGIFLYWYKETERSKN